MVRSLGCFFIQSDKNFTFSMFLQHACLRAACEHVCVLEHTQSYRCQVIRASSRLTFPTALNAGGGGGGGGHAANGT